METGFRLRGINVPLPPLAVRPLWRHRVGLAGIGTQGRFEWSASAESPVPQGWTQGTSSNHHVAPSERGHKQNQQKEDLDHLQVECQHSNNQV